MTTISVTRETSVPADQVLFAARDFSARRLEVFPAVRAEHFVVHSAAGTRADVTEGTPTGRGLNWERCDYDWSQPGRVVATVTDSNVYAIPGSVWTLTAHPTESGGSIVRMEWERMFNHTARGRCFNMLFRALGRPLFGDYARKVVRNIERVTAAPAR